MRWTWILLFAVACGGEERDAQTPVVAAARKDPAWLETAADTCEKVASCTSSKDVSACVSSWLSQPEALRRCIGQAKSCVDVDLCRSGAGDARAAAFCMKPGMLAGCDGDRLISCSESEATVTDCGSLGAKCSEQRLSGIVVRACFSPEKCPAGAPEARCDGEGAVISCRDGAIDRIACGSGTKCRERTDENGEPSASCVLATGTCVRGCNGDRLVDCVSGPNEARAFGRGRAAITDCAAEGLTCSGAGPRAACVVRDVDCDPERLPTCEDGNVAVCAAGRLLRVSCDRIGMGRCSAAGSALAACSPKAVP